MKVFLDMNVLLSAVLTRNGVCSGLINVLKFHHDAITADYCLNELEQKLATKFGHRPELSLIAEDLIELIRPVPSVVGEPGSVRDPKDEVVLASAVAASTDLLVTGDRGLLDVVIPPLRIVSPAEALAILGG